MMAQLDGLKVNYNMTGPDKAPTLVIAHSLGCDMSMFDAVTMRLPQGLRVVTYDLRGHIQIPTGAPTAAPVPATRAMPGASCRTAARGSARRRMARAGDPSGSSGTPMSAVSA
jgi:pimeloyl-ACP methyl ester carboxylesterase